MYRAIEREQNEGTDDNCLLSPQARHNEPLLKEKPLELSHTRKGSGVST